MNYDVFVSHSSRDQRAVEAICTRLEAQGITCFVSYRDAEKGGAWARTIAEALENSRMMLVVASENFNSSRQTDREVGIAGEKDPPMPMLVFRLSDAKFEGVKHYYLNNLNWINAFPDPTKHFRELYDTVQNMLAKEALSKNRISAATAQAQTQTQIPRTKAVAKNDKNVLKIAATAGAVLLTAVVAVVCFALAGTPAPEPEFAEAEGDFVGEIVPAPLPVKQEKFESEPEPALPKVDVKPVEPVPPKVDVKPVEPVPEKPKTEQPVKIVNPEIPATLRFRVKGKEWRIGKYEVTQKQYEFIMKENLSEHKGGDLPVENVSAEKAEEYCKRLTALEQKKNPKIRYRLPTVEEWECACSAGIKDWKYIKNQEAKLAEFGHIKTLDGPKLIGQKKARDKNGPYDVVGNVREICVDKDGGYVALGGSYLYGIEKKGCGTQFPDIGFRIVREEIPEKDFPNIPETVQIPGKDWKIGKYEVTEEQYEFIMNKNPSKSKKGAGKNFPVDNVSVADAREYCRKLTEYARKQGGIDENYKFDIPTRDEWEYACRAGTKTRYHFGDRDSDLKSYAWYRNKEKHPVGKKKPNKWEIYDMHGNVAELCQWFNEKIYLRGGNFDGDSTDLRIDSPVKEGKKGGLRVVLVRDYPKADDNSVSEEARKAVVPETVGIKDKNWRIGKYEVTQKEYESVMCENPSKPLRDGTCPVTHVTWTDAVKYCKKLTELAREKDEISQIMEFRLPTLEEWKHCAGEGKEDMDDAAWYVGNSGKKVHPVGGKKPNALGIFDMHGNVSEFCYDGGKGWRIGGNYVKAKDYCANFEKTIEAQKEPEALKESDKVGYIGFRIVLDYLEGFEPKPLFYPEMVSVSEGWGKKWQIGKYEVTQKEYESVMRTNPSEHKGDDLPVENVTWAEAEQYCRRLTRSARNAKKIGENQEYRLPTFKEWEYACRAGTKTNYWSGITEFYLSRVGWYEGNSGKKTHSVGERDKIGNEFGLCDVHGNVAEWCKDASLRDPSKRIFRGGAYDSSAEECDFFHVGEALRNDPKPNVGFRVVLVNTDN